MSPTSVVKPEIIRAVAQMIVESGLGHIPDQMKLSIINTK